MEQSFTKPFSKLLKDKKSKPVQIHCNSLDFSPSKWSDYFEEQIDLEVKKSKGIFRVYLSGFKDEENTSLPVLVLLHGAGYSGLTWSLFAKEIMLICNCKIIAIDLRGHGSTQTENDHDLSVDTIVDDVVNILTQIFSKKNKENKIHYDSSNSIGYTPLEEEKKFPNLLIVGHSMGGSMAVHATYKLANLANSIAGLVVIDVVETTALEALQSMHFVLKNRQKSFDSIRNGIEWCFKTNQTKRLEAAKISFPSQIKNQFSNKTGSDEIDEIENTKFELHQYKSDTILEETETDDEKLLQNENSTVKKIELNTPPDVSHNSNDLDSLNGKYIWRVNLFKSEKYWKSWFYDLSNLFLNAPCNGRLLLLANIDNLDKSLTIGQMQGKFQMHVLSHSRHAVQEDAPDKVAEIIANFLIRNKLTIKKKNFEETFPCC